MEDAYYIAYGDMYLHGFSLNGNPVWTLDLVDALWMTEDMSRRWIRSLQILFDLSGLEVQKV
jgi:hypothetical protein